MTIAPRSMEPGNRPFVISGWSSSLRLSRDVPGNPSSGNIDKLDPVNDVWLVQEFMHCGCPLRVGNEVLERLKIAVQARQSVLQSDDWSDAVEAVIHVVEHGGELGATHRAVIEAALFLDMASGSGAMGRDLDGTSCAGSCAATQTCVDMQVN